MVASSRLAGALRRDPRGPRISIPAQPRESYTPEVAPPSTMGPQNPTQGMERLSPGVYRSASGELVSQSGRPLQRPQQPTRQAPPQPQQPAMPASPAPLTPEMRAALEGANGAAFGQQFGNTMNNLGQQFGANAGNRGIQFGNKPMQITPEMDPGYFNQIMQQPVNDLMYRYPPGQAPSMDQFRQAFQPQQQAQPNSVSGLLRRNR